MAALALLGAPLAAQAGVKAVDAASKTVSVRFADGVSRTYELRYTSFVDQEHHNLGRHYSHGHPFDDRQCRWDARGYIKRQVCLESESGQPFCDARWDRIYDRPVLSKVSSIASQFQPANCDLSRTHYEPQVAAVREDVVGALPETMRNDRANFLRDDLSVDVAVLAVDDVQLRAEATDHAGRGAAHAARPTGN